MYRLIWRVFLVASLAPTVFANVPPRPHFRRQAPISNSSTSSAASSITPSSECASKCWLREAFLPLNLVTTDATTAESTVTATVRTYLTKYLNTTVTRIVTLHGETDFSGLPTFPRTAVVSGVTLTYPTSYISYLPDATVNFFTTMPPGENLGGQTCSFVQSKDVSIPLPKLQPSDLIFQSPTVTISDNGAAFYALPTPLFQYISRLGQVSETNVADCIAAGYGGGPPVAPVAHTTVAKLTEVHEQVVLTGPNSQSTSSADNTKGDAPPPAQPPPAESSSPAGNAPAVNSPPPQNSPAPSANSPPPSNDAPPPTNAASPNQPSSSPGNSPAAAVPPPPQTLQVNSQPAEVVAASTGNAFVVNDAQGSAQTFSPGQTGVVNNVPVSFASTGSVVVYGSQTTIPLAPAAAPASPGSQQTAPPAPVLTVGTETFTAGANGVITLAPNAVLTPQGSAVTYSGTTFSLGRSGTVVINGASSTLGSQPITPPLAVLTVGSETFTAGGTGVFTLAPNIVLAPQGAPVTYSGTTLSLAPSGTVIINGVTSTLAQPYIAPAVQPTAAPPVVTIAGHTYTPSISIHGSVTDVILAPGTTLSAGGVVTVDGILVSLAPGGSALVVGSSTSVTISSSKPTTTGVGDVIASGIGAAPFEGDAARKAIGGGGAMIFVCQIVVLVYL